MIDMIVEQQKELKSDRAPRILVVSLDGSATGA